MPEGAKGIAYACEAKLKEGSSEGTVDSFFALALEISPSPSFFSGGINRGCCPLGQESGRVSILVLSATSSDTLLMLLVLLVLPDSPNLALNLIVLFTIPRRGTLIPYICHFNVNIRHALPSWPASCLQWVRPRLPAFTPRRRAPVIHITPQNVPPDLCCTDRLPATLRQMLWHDPIWPRHARPKSKGRWLCAAFRFLSCQCSSPFPVAFCKDLAVTGGVDEKSGHADTGDGQGPGRLAGRPGRVLQ